MTGRGFPRPLPVIASEAKQSSATLEDSLFHPRARVGPLRSDHGPSETVLIRPSSSRLICHPAEPLANRTS
jgi:hypothetical protein